ncbi:hypothetical protein L208DRAFT_1415668, partial [Tricholoma matsutake]
MHHCNFFMAFTIMLFVSLVTCAPVSHPTSDSSTTSEWLVNSVAGIEIINATPSDNALSSLQPLDVLGLSISAKTIPHFIITTTLTMSDYLKNFINTSNKRLPSKAHRRSVRRYSSRHPV